MVNYGVRKFLGDPSIIFQVEPPTNDSDRIELRDSPGTPSTLYATIPISAPLGARTFGRWSEAPDSPPTLVINRMERVPCSTGTSKTKVAPMVQNLPVEQQLHTIRKSPNLWANLVNYATERNPTPTRPSTFFVNPEIAKGKDQAKAVFALHGWCQWQQQVTSHLVNSEADVQDVLNSELFMYANEVLKVRIHSLL